MSTVIQDAVIPNAAIPAAVPEKVHEDMEGTEPIVLHLKPVLQLSEDQFFEFCAINRVLPIERNAEGDLIIMSPAGLGSGEGEAEIIRQLANWAKQNGTGKAFNSNTGFRLPNQAIRAPDASWVSHSRLNSLTEEEYQKFAQVCPEFVIELRSPSDRIRDLQAIMLEYLENGIQMGLMIDPKHRRVYLYQPHQPLQILDNHESIACDPVLPGFELVVRELW